MSRYTCQGWKNADSEEIRICGEEFLRIRGFAATQIKLLTQEAGSLHGWTLALRRFLNRCDIADPQLTRNDYFLAWQRAYSPFWKRVFEREQTIRDLFAPVDWKTIGAEANEYATR
ncbi:hypothetical protein HYR54_13780 [Candidatus Acetothermia bacterium]|nr:hypothetical protein [Candidatus Acetothermia bacterium]